MALSVLVNTLFYVYKEMKEVIAIMRKLGTVSLLQSGIAIDAVRTGVVISQHLDFGLRLSNLSVVSY